MGPPLYAAEYNRMQISTKRMVACASMGPPLYAAEDTVPFDHSVILALASMGPPLYAAEDFAAPRTSRISVTRFNGAAALRGGRHYLLDGLPPFTYRLQWGRRSTRRKTIGG